MDSQAGDKPANKRPLLDTSFWIAAMVAVLTMAFSILIMGIFATNSDSPLVTLAGLAVIAGCPGLLGLMIIAKTLSRACAARLNRNQRAMTMLVTLTVYCIGIPAITFGTWQGVRMFVQAPTYQEANIEVPNSIPVF